MSFSILLNFDKVIKKMATFSLLPNFGNYIRGLFTLMPKKPYQILAFQNFGIVAKILTR